MDADSRVMFVNRYWYAESIAQIAEPFVFKRCTRINEEMLSVRPLANTRELV